MIRTGMILVLGRSQRPTGFVKWGGWGSNPRPADYEKCGPALWVRYLHGYHGAVPPMTLVEPIARMARSTNRSTVAAPYPITLSLCNIAESIGLTSAANGGTVWRSLMRVSNVTHPALLHPQP